MSVTLSKRKNKNHENAPPSVHPRILHIFHFLKISSSDTLELGMRENNNNKLYTTKEGKIFYFYNVLNSVLLVLEKL